MSKIRDQRSEKREWCFARVLLSGIPGQLRDINEKGIRIVLMKEKHLDINSLQKIHILPDESIDIEPFEIEAYLRWNKDDPFGSFLGFEVVEFKDNGTREDFNRLLEYYRDDL